MSRLITMHGPEAFFARMGAGPLPALDPAELARHMPDAHAMVMASDGSTVGRCSLWWRETPLLPNERVGILGHYAAQDAEAGRLLLQRACAHLAGVGCTLALGPMDGSTWRHYRLIVDRGGEPPFFLEPDHPAE